MNTIFHKTAPVAASVAKNLHVEDQFGKLIWVKVFKNGPSKICVRQSLKILLGPFPNTLTQLLPVAVRNISVIVIVFKRLCHCIDSNILWSI